MSGTEGKGFRMSEAAEGVRLFWLEPSALDGLTHLSHGIWDRVRSQTEMAALLDVSACELDAAGYLEQARFCRRLADGIRDHDADGMGLRDFAVEALRAVGFGPSEMAEWAGMFAVREGAVAASALPR